MDPNTYNNNIQAYMNLFQNHYPTDKTSKIILILFDEKARTSQKKNRVPFSPQENNQN
jgi:hypothetical protein